MRFVDPIYTEEGRLTALQTIIPQSCHGQLERSKGQSLDWSNDSTFDVDLLIRRLEDHKHQLEVLAAKSSSQRQEPFRFGGSVTGARSAAHGFPRTKEANTSRRIPEAIVVVPMAQVTTEHRTQVSPPSRFPPRSVSLWPSSPDRHRQMMSGRTRNEPDWSREQSLRDFPITMPGPMHHVRIHSASPKLSGEISRGPFTNDTTRTHSRSMTMPGHQPRNFSPARTLVSTPVDLQFIPDSPATLVAPDDPTQLKDELLAMGDSDDDRFQRELELLSLTSGPSLLERRKIGRQRSGPIPLVTGSSCQLPVSAPMPTPIQASFFCDEEQHQHKPRRKFSLFRARGKRRVEVDADDLIDMYMTDEQLSEMRSPRLKTRPSGLTRKFTWRRRKVSAQPSTMRKDIGI